jgi:hypothetical protein
MGESQGATSVAAMVDAQFGNIRVLLPYDDFEDDYQGEDGDRMIAFPGGRDVNAAAEVTGYNPNLQLGAPVPCGSRVKVGIPLAVAFGTGDVAELYRYFFVFRDRNIRDHRSPGGEGTRPPWHYPRQGGGAIDNSVFPPTAWFPIDARYHDLGYEQAEPTLAAPAGMAMLNVYPEAVIPRRVLVPNAMVPGGVLSVVQQGIYDPAQVPTANDAMRAEFQLDAIGDDIIIYAQKIPDSEGVFADWDFDGEDAPFSNVFGRGTFTPNAERNHPVFTDGGIRLTTGSNP